MSADQPNAEDDFWASFQDAVNTPDSGSSSSRTPATSAPQRKRTAVQAELQSDHEEHTASSPQPHTTSTPTSLNTVNRNFTIAARRVGGQKKLRTEQMQELEGFSTNTSTIQNIQLYAQLLSLNNKLDKIVASAPPFQIVKDSELHINLVSYSNSVFFSSNLAAYKGSIALNHILDIVKRLRFGIPHGLENNSASWNKVSQAVQSILTQIRGVTKKKIKRSIEGADPSKHWSLFRLTDEVLKETNCKLTVPVMARIALMRNVFRKFPGEDFWDRVDTRLQTVLKAGTTPAKLTRAFRLILDKDRNEHGDHFETEGIDDYVTDELQRGVDDGIAQTMQRWTAVGNSEEEPVAREQQECSGSNPSSPSPSGALSQTVSESAPRAAAA
ncbi:hypothetical protein ACG7TL_005613 [Trametes sanguinea]